MTQLSDKQWSKFLNDSCPKAFRPKAKSKKTITIREYEMSLKNLPKVLRFMGDIIIDERFDVVKNRYGKTTVGGN